MRSIEPGSFLRRNSGHKIQREQHHSKRAVLERFRPHSGDPNTKQIIVHVRRFEPCNQSVSAQNSSILISCCFTGRFARDRSALNAKLFPVEEISKGKHHVLGFRGEAQKVLESHVPCDA